MTWPVTTAPGRNRSARTIGVIGYGNALLTGRGLAALLALNILEGFDLAKMEPFSSERLHLEIEALRLAFADTPLVCG
jgi:gamma-glutamyltranspeptidase